MKKTLNVKEKDCDHLLFDLSWRFGPSQIIE